MSNDSTVSFDRMRGMLVRAAEIRDSEQQQIFDSLDEIHARLAALDALGTVRKRLTEMPDRTEVGVLAERLDETVAKLDAQEAVLAAVLRAVEALPDRLATPFAQLDGRLDGMAGRLEGVSGRMDGLDDRLGGLHKRLDDLDNRHDRHEMRLDAMPAAVGSPVKERLDDIERSVRGQFDAATRSFDETGEGLRNLLGDTGIGLHRRLEELSERPVVDPTEPLDALARQLESIVARLDAVAGRVDELEDGVNGRLGSLGSEVQEKFSRLDATLAQRPDAAALRTLVERANEDSERRNAGQLEDAMATFAELILGRGSAVQSPLPPPRPFQRRSRSTVAVRSTNGVSTGEAGADDPDDH